MLGHATGVVTVDFEVSIAQSVGALKWGVAAYHPLPCFRLQLALHCQRVIALFQAQL
jgi:hypothetical protein